MNMLLMDKRGLNLFLRIEMILNGNFVCHLPIIFKGKKNAQSKEMPLVRLDPIEDRQIYDQVLPQPTPSFQENIPSSPPSPMILGKRDPPSPLSLVPHKSLQNFEEISVPEQLEFYSPLCWTFAKDQLERIGFGTFKFDTLVDILLGVKCQSDVKAVMQYLPTVYPQLFQELATSLEWRYRKYSALQEVS
eukprot:TRINITY_DN22199_c0_g1_i2.p1 TRINITY_DN22199_c0_g1~~TRINITY_DN22199_c0_g1_i2.p1  ORF type:complete len:190 (+),score=38.56 TRINITY_DN22199_c0_g1_i2:340-909(+)